MCGLVGVFADGAVAPERFRQCERALELIRHRGPDCQRTARYDRAVLGHARLSIIDPDERSHQPFSSADGRYSIVFNGEIYNHAELRAALETRGVRFETLSDTEVLLNAWVEWGAGCLDRLNGMWAFAIYDRDRHRLFMTRDRFGIKPLYWMRSAGELYFASELKALFPFDLPMRVDPRHLLPAPVRRAGAELRDTTIYANVHTVPPGSYLQIDAVDAVAPKRWWRLDADTVEVPGRFADRVDRLRALMEDAVRIRVTNDVPTALALSGGIDSSSIYGVCRSMMRSGWTPETSSSGDRKWLQAFTAAYPGAACDESDYAAACVSHWLDPAGLRRIEPDVEDFPRLLEELVWHQEVPVWSPVAAAYHAFYRQVSDAGYRVILEGHGADEIFGGYEGQVRCAYQEYRRSRRWVSAWRAYRCYVGLTDPDAATSDIAVLRRLGQRLGRRVLGARRRRGTGSPPGPVRDGQLRHMPAGAWRGPVASDSESLAAAFLDAFTAYPLPMFLRVFDRATMAHGMESTTPYLDHRLVQYVFALPDVDKVHAYTKQILRAAASDVLPDAVRRRRGKRGFSAPYVDWFNLPRTREFLDDLFRSRAATESAYADAGIVQERLDAARGRALTHAEIDTLWPAVNLHLWELQFDGAGRVAPRLAG